MKSGVATINFQLKHARVKQSVISLLERVGIEGHRRPNQSRVSRTKSFWLRNEDNLHYILFDAHKSFRALCKRLHPDRPGGDPDRMSELTADWRALEQRFANKNIRLGSTEGRPVRLEQLEYEKENRKAKARRATKKWREENVEKFSRQKARAKALRALKNNRLTLKPTGVT